MGRSATELDQAPWRRRITAHTIDSVLIFAVGLPRVLRRFAEVRNGTGSRGGGSSPLPKLASQAGQELAQVLGQRYGSLGQRAAGVRTVDARDGVPVGLPTTLALGSLRIGGRLWSGWLTRGDPAARRLANPLVVMLVLGQAERRLRRRYAPTVEVLAGEVRPLTARRSDRSRPA